MGDKTSNLHQKSPQSRLDNLAKSACTLHLHEDDLMRKQCEGLLGGLSSLQLFKADGIVFDTKFWRQISSQTVLIFHQVVLAVVSILMQRVHIKVHICRINGCKINREILLRLNL